jgi:circadian clock protein KaiB
MNPRKRPSGRKEPRTSPRTSSESAGSLRAEESEVDPEYLLRLFVSGFTSRSQRAIDNLKSVCERYLAGRYRIDVVDLHQSPGRARDEQIIATPTLLKVLPVPERRLIGDLSQVEKVLRSLDLK